MRAIRFNHNWLEAESHITENYAPTDPGNPFSELMNYAFQYFVQQDHLDGKLSEHLAVVRTILKKHGPILDLKRAITIANENRHVEVARILTDYSESAGPDGGSSAVAEAMAGLAGGGSGAGAGDDSGAKAMAKLAGDGGTGDGSAHLRDQFFAAAKDGNSEQIKALLGIGISPDIQDEDGNTALHRAAKNNNYDTVELLINAGANPNVQNIHGNTALHIATRDGYIRMAKFLIAHERTNVNLQNSNADTALHFTARDGKPQLTAALLARGADHTIRNGAGRTALEVATRNERPNVAQLLRAHSAKHRPSGGGSGAGTDK